MAETKPPESPKSETSKGLTSLTTGRSYKVRADGETAWWWKRKHDGLPEVTIEGKTADVLGKPAGELQMHPLVEALKDRSTGLRANHPVAKDWDQLYVGTVQGRRELVHPHELEEIKG